MYVIVLCCVQVCGCECVRVRMSELQMVVGFVVRDGVMICFICELISFNFVF